MTLNQVRKDVEDILGKDLVYYSKGQMVYETIIEKHYPHIDVELLCYLYGEHKGWQDEIVKEYIEIIREREQERIAAKEM